MESIRTQLNKPIIAGIAGLVIGLILGLIYAWLISPVEWVNVPVESLTAEGKVEYLRMAIDSFTVNNNAELANQRYQALGEGRQDALIDILQNPVNQSPQEIQDYANAVVPGGALALLGGEPAPGATPAAETPAAGGATDEQGGGWLSTLLQILCVVGLLLAAALLVFYFMRSRGTPRSAGAAPREQQAAREAAWTEYAGTGAEPPMAQFMTTYRLGDDLFDDSFSIDSPAGEFMGECGVGISETIGVGDPKKVTAFEVWLFDKNDIQTVTKVLMSAHAFNDDSLRSRLAAKGEPVRVAPGAETELETQTLRLVARVEEMAYGEGALPTDSYFDRFAIKLAVWQK